LTRRRGGLFEIARNEGRSVLLGHEAERLASSYGIPTPRSALAATAEESERLSKKLGFPVVMKIVSPEIIHKTDVGGVRLGIRSPKEAGKTFAELATIAKRIGNFGGVLIQKLARPAQEFVIGGVRDRQFGPIVMFGLGGIFVDLYRDVSFRLVPVSEGEAVQMIGEIRGAPFFEGYRGSPRLDKRQCARTIVKVGRMMSELREISSIDINPLLVYPKGVLAVDVRVILEAKSKNVKTR
jgi:acyl-CoA synthetase (NDP forming)